MHGNMLKSYKQIVMRLTQPCQSILYIMEDTNHRLSLVVFLPHKRTENK